METGSKKKKKALSHVFIYGDFSSRENKQRLLLQDGQICLRLLAAKTFGLNCFCGPGMRSHCRIRAYAVMYDVEGSDTVDTHTQERLGQKAAQQLTKTLDI